MLSLCGYFFYLIRYFRLLLSISPKLIIFLISQTFSWLSGSISGISFIRGISESTNSKTEICLILMIFMLSGKFSLYMTGPRTLKILKDFSLTKFNLLLSYMVWINVIFILGVLYRRYTLFFFLRVSPQIFLLSANFFIILLKNTKFYLSSSYNL